MTNHRIPKYPMQWQININKHILVILNGANMSRVAPPHSYIDVQVRKLNLKYIKWSKFYFKDFKSTQDLAKYLLKVSEDDMLFASYFWWRDYYKVQVFFDISGIRA